MTEIGSSGAGKKARSLRLVVVVPAVAALVVVGVTLLRDRDPTQPGDLSQLVQSGAAKGFNVLLISIDTTRPDHLGCYGYQLAETPTIDSLVSHGVRFDDAVTSSPMTLPSHATLLTGLYPPNHGIRANGLFQLGPEHLTLSETLKAHGYETAAFVGCFILDERFGLAQGFDVYDFEVTKKGFFEGCLEINQRPANVVTDAVIKWLDRRQQAQATAPFFAFVHYFDPHVPYTSAFTRLSKFTGRPYDAEIAFVDVQLKVLLDDLRKRGLLERTLIVLVTDHGEGLGDHGEPTHGFFLYGATMQVGLILSCPALFDRAYRVDHRVVGLVDVRPTIEDLVGISPVTPGDGQSLVAGGRDPDRAIYLETFFGFYGAGWSPLYGLRRHTDKYILAPRSEYYDLEEDPDELNNLYASGPGQAQVLEQQLAELRFWESEGEAKLPDRRMSPEEIERLRSLGYVCSEIDPSSEDLPDPKDMMPVFNMHLEARELHAQGKSEEALSLWLEVLEANETMVPAQLALARAYRDLGRDEEAIEVLRKSAKTSPQSSTFVLLAEILAGLNRYDQAAEALDAAEALSADDGMVPLTRGRILVRQGRDADAIEQFKEALRVDEHRVGILAREAILNAVERLEHDEREF